MLKCTAYKKMIVPQTSQQPLLPMDAVGDDNSRRQYCNCGTLDSLNCDCEGCVVPDTCSDGCLDLFTAW